MPSPDPNDPWASLAETLGVGPGGEQTPKPSQPAQDRPRQPPRGERPRPRAAAPEADWDAVAADLGLGTPPRSPEPPARPAESRPPRRDAEQEAFVERRESRRSAEASGAAHGDAAPVREPALDGPRDSGESRPLRDGDDDRGGRRGRRRRGRRGGRGRRERDEGRPAGESRDDRSSDRDEFDRGGESRNSVAGRDERPSSDGDVWDAEFSPSTAAVGREGGTDQESDEDRPRRRRRRGRRGGRGRSRAERPETGAVGDAPAGPANADDHHDDEPLPTSYGMGATRSGEGRPGETTGREGSERQRSAEADDRQGGRRRRRRRGGEGRTRPEGQQPQESAGDRSRGGRRGRRGAGSSSRDDDRRSGSRSSRSRRSDFAPVAAGHDEDDEGLEFLGVEEAVRDPSRRETRPEDDDVIAESGLNTVLDVPSWIEAIGIVIAGNLDARSRSGRGDSGRSRDR